jgi:23S rRNA (uracil1939-C5)-methyltransferase
MSKRNRIIQLENITLLTAGAKGVSIAKSPDGKTIMAKGGVPGDVVNLQIRKSKKSYLEGTVTEVLELSPDRVAAKCQHFGLCGGCKWQNMSYEKQLFYKQDEVYNHITRIGGISDFETVDILGAPEQYYYRNKMEFSFSNARWLTEDEVRIDGEIADRNALGFHIPGQWSKVLDLQECHLQEEPSNTLRNAVREYALEIGLEFYNLRHPEGHLRTMMLRQNSAQEWMVLFQFFQDDAEKRIKLFEFIQEKFPQIKTLMYAINPKGNDSIYDLDIEIFSGDGFLMEDMDGLKFKIGPKSFFQTNYQQALALYRKTLEFADLDGTETVYDLYTGTGTIAQYLARKAKHVIGIESVPEAIAAAKENAAYNNITNVDFYCGDMKDIFTPEFIATQPHANVVVTDPPRDGMHPKVVENILRLAPEKIVYVSCNSATQARDLALMKEHYQLVKILPVDMFPQTHHVENIALLIKK